MHPIRRALTVVAALAVPAVGGRMLPAIAGETAVAQTAASAPAGTTSNPSGSCIVLKGAKDRVIENLHIGPCGGHGIEVTDSENVIIRNVTINDTKESGVYIEGSQSVEVRESRISNAVSGVYAVNSRSVRVACNTLLDQRGPVPRGQHVQFNHVVGGNNSIRCNVGRNQPGHGSPEDAINLYKSHGTSWLPITVIDNLIVGGGPSESGGGIMLGDSGGSYQLAKGNILVDPGQYGIAVSSGWNISVMDNLVFGRRQPFTNVGIYAWNQYPQACHGISIARNKVFWLSKTGRANPFWDGQNCGKIAGIADNKFAARLSPDIAEIGAPECGCHVEGRR
jgi:Right handed beta helix region